MLINLEWDASALAAPQSFRDGMQTAANMLQAAFDDIITVNIEVGYGTIGNSPLPNQNFSEGGSSGDFESYAALRSLLYTHATSSDDFTSVNALPDATSVAGVSSFFIGFAQAKALGLLAADGTEVDGEVGIGTTFSGNPLIAIGLHELTHAMGRLTGQSQDLFRFNEDHSGNRVVSNVSGTPAYFSIDGGTTDLADFGVSSDRADFLNPPNSNLTPNDPFNEFVGNGVSLTAVDLTMMDVLGFHRPARPATPNVPDDLNGDGNSDILLANDNGTLALWEMNGGQKFVTPTIGNPGPGWHVAGLGDFNGDGSSDLLYRHDNGTLAIWDMRGGAIVSAPAAGNPGPTWHIAGIGDFNGDRHSDILFKNDNGSLAMWEMNDGQLVAAPAAGNPGTGWHVMGVGDFYNRGFAGDILFQNDNGSLAIWEMNEGQIVAAPGLGNPGPTWHLKGIGDFGGDHKSDILFQNDNGTLGIWETSGGQIVAAPGLGNPGAGWHVAAVGDYNGDGNSDILLHNDNGTLAMWEMSGGTIIGSPGLGNPGTTWHAITEPLGV